MCRRGKRTHNRRHTHILCATFNPECCEPNPSAISATPVASQLHGLVQHKFFIKQRLCKFLSITLRRWHFVFSSPPGDKNKQFMQPAAGCLYNDGGAFFATEAAAGTNSHLVFQTCFAFQSTSAFQLSVWYAPTLLVGRILEYVQTDVCY